MSETASPLVGIVMGSDSDWPKIKAAAAVLDEFGVPYEVRVMSAHRTPDVVRQYATSAAARGLKVLIAAAGGAAHLAGVVASHTTLPVIGLPVPTELSGGLDSLLSIVQMPGDVPVATVASAAAAPATPACWPSKSSPWATPVSRKSSPPSTASWSRTSATKDAAIARRLCCRREVTDLLAASRQLALASRLRLTPASAASTANCRWTSGGTRTTNFPL